ncbi:dienelactone hydrolase family protein [Paraburkholderia sediminicola]|uniref:dienelactone hydrolase family protein n=1 Tax=Paraburkholderia sediminicola TaxID=458836 RepID=UPI0038B73B0E
MVEERIVLPTRDGSCDGYVYYPDTSARYPAVVIYMDSMGMREELRVMARRLAAGGYFVLLPNLYYRLSKGDIVINADLIDEDGPDNQLMWKLNRSIYNREVVSDSESLLRFLDAHEHAGKGRVGVIGYCMSGRYAVTA